MVLKSVSNRPDWNFLYNFSSRTFQTEIFRDLRRRTQVPQVKISDFGSLYLLRYTLWNLGFLNGPKISFKRVSLTFSL
jgi:hypothetical protein